MINATTIEEEGEKDSLFFQAQTLRSGKNRKTKQARNLNYPIFFVLFVS